MEIETVSSLVSINLHINIYNIVYYISSQEDVQRHCSMEVT